MKISGLQKLSLLNYPDELCAVIFTTGCNFRCPFCHNSQIVFDSLPKFEENEVLDFLKEKKKFLDAVCISGGEPLLQSDLKQFIMKVKAIGYKVKLDTNGFLTDRLEDLINTHLLDYIAMDIKHTFAKYNSVIGVSENVVDNIKRSIEVIKNSKVPYEFRTTLVKNFHTRQDVEEIARYIQGEKYFLQNFEDSNEIIQDGLSGFNKQELQDFLISAQKYNPNTKLREQ